MGAVFQGRASHDDCLLTFGELLYDLKLWEDLKSPEDLVLHNFAVGLLRQMGLTYIINPKKGQLIRFEIAYPEPGEMSEETRDMRRD